MRWLDDTDHVFELSLFLPSPLREDNCEATIRNYSPLQSSEEAAETKQMIAAVIVLSLISLLVATDSEPAGSPVPPSPEPPLRPGNKAMKVPERERLAA